MRIIFAAIGRNAKAADSIAGIDRLLPGERTDELVQDRLVQTVIRVYDLRRQDITEWIQASFGRPLATMTMVEHAVIAAGLAEMLGMPDTPSAVIINEAVDIANAYGSEGGGALVNGILHDIATRQRP